MDFSFENKRTPVKGHVLISDPFSQSDFFSRSVIYLCDHNEKGTFGLVLNNYIDLDPSKVSDRFPEITSAISIGGPVQTESLFFIHTLGDLLPGSVYVADGIYMGGEYDLLLDFISKGEIPPHSVRFFLGYSGWSPGQLEHELLRNSWLVAPVSNSDEIMNTENDSIWKDFMKREGKKYDVLSRAPLSFHDN